MAQHVRAQLALDACLDPIVLENLPEADARQSAASSVHEEQR
jgi:hypothetical protein